MKNAHDHITLTSWEPFIDTYIANAVAKFSHKTTRDLHGKNVSILAMLILTTTIKADKDIITFTWSLHTL